MYEVAAIRNSELLDEVLDPRLDQRVELVLRLDHERPVPERVGDAAVVRGAARHLIDAVEAEPDRELEREMRPSARAAGVPPRSRSSRRVYPVGPLTHTDCLSGSLRSTEEAGWTR